MPTGDQTISGIAGPDETNAGFHRWHLDHFLPMLSETLALRGDLSQALDRVTDHHRAHLSGEEIDSAQASQDLEDMLSALFTAAFPYQPSYDKAHASASDYAGQNKKMIDDAFGSAKAYCDYYADLNARACRKAFAAANAKVHAHRLAELFIRRPQHPPVDSESRTAIARACAAAYAGAFLPTEFEQRHKMAMTRLEAEQPSDEGKRPDHG